MKWFVSLKRGLQIQYFIVSRNLSLIDKIYGGGVFFLVRDDIHSELIFLKDLNIH